jgi:hypothetical protein
MQNASGVASRACAEYAPFRKHLHLPRRTLIDSRLFVERFRYRTKALVGSWRATREEAIADAIRAGQAAPIGENADADELIERQERAPPAGSPSR